MSGGKIHQLSTNRIRRIKEHSTLSTDIMLYNLWTNGTSNAMQWGTVNTTVWPVLLLKSDVSTLSPICPPAVPHNPGLWCVANKLDCVVNIHVLFVITAVPYSPRIRIPVRGIHSNRKGSNISQVLNNGFLVVRRKIPIALQRDSWGSIGLVEEARACVPIG